MLQVFVRTECHRFEFHLVGTCGAWCPCLGAGKRYMEIPYPFDVHPGAVFQVIGQFLAERDDGCLDVCHGERGAVLYFPCQIVGVDALPVYYTGVIALLARTYRIG